MKVLSVVGARPQLVKLAPVSAAMRAAGHEHSVVHTGQHYDANMSAVFFASLDIPEPDVNLGVGSGSHGAQTGAMLIALEPIFAEYDPDWVVVYGDTNSTIAAGLAAVKLHLPLAHLEAGLRSFNRRMPEEHNRIMTDHASDLLLAPTQVAMDHLAAEGLSERSVLVGDVMVDVCFQVRDAALADGLPAQGLPSSLDMAAPYLVCTLHRPDNTDDPVRLAGIIERIGSLPMQVALLAHPRLVAKAAQHGINLGQGSIHVGEPLPYGDLVRAVMGSAGVITDSGGLQKEAYLLKRPGTTIRTETEWVETLDGGWNVLVPDPADLDLPVWIETVTRPVSTTQAASPYGAGTAARLCVEVLTERLH
jgi:UDP-N-acetylglucosamine 2-epimerase (non-hydrolysing)